MSAKQTDSSKYLSKYGGNYITANNYIVEMICERIAAKDKLGALPVKFWNSPKWKKVYFQQLLIVNGLLKMYAPQAIIAGLKKHPNVYSLRAQWLDDTFKEEQEKLDKFKEKIEEKPPVQIEEPKLVIEKPRESFSEKKSIRSKLRDLD
jgi:hypothetical protein